MLADNRGATDQDTRAGPPGNRQHRSGCLLVATFHQGQYDRAQFLHRLFLRFVEYPGLQCVYQCEQLPRIEWQLTCGFLQLKATLDIAYRPIIVCRDCTIV